MKREKKAKEFTNIIEIDTSITTPVYKQIVQSVYKNIDSGILKKNDRLPSVNQIAAEFSLARDSVFTAYNDLRVSSGNLISKCKRLFLIYPDTLRTRDIIAGFNEFSKKKMIDTGIKSDIGNDVQKQDAFIVIDDNHLVDIIKVAKEKKWKLGKDLGVMSYNETNLKSIIAEGITTITTDFYAMGKTMAEMVSTGTQGVIENPFIMIDRGSF